MGGCNSCFRDCLQQLKMLVWTVQSRTMAIYNCFIFSFTRVYISRLFFNCCKLTLKLLLHPSIHPFIRSPTHPSWNTLFSLLKILYSFTSGISTFSDFFPLFVKTKFYNIYLFFLDHFSVITFMYYIIYFILNGKWLTFFSTFLVSLVP